MGNSLGTCIGYSKTRDDTVYKSALIAQKIVKQKCGLNLTTAEAISIMDYIYHPPSGVPDPVIVYHWNAAVLAYFDNTPPPAAAIQRQAAGFAPGVPTKSVLLSYVDSHGGSRIANYSGDSDNVRAFRTVADALNCAWQCGEDLPYVNISAHGPNPPVAKSMIICKSDDVNPDVGMAFFFQSV